MQAAGMLADVALERQFIQALHHVQGFLQPLFGTQVQVEILRAKLAIEIHQQGRQAIMRPQHVGDPFRDRRCAATAP